MPEPVPPQVQEHRTNLAVVVHRGSQDRIAARLTRFWFDGCELTECECLECGDLIKVEIGGLGAIRAQVCRCKEGITSVRFLEDCPV